MAAPTKGKVKKPATERQMALRGHPAAHRMCAFGGKADIALTCRLVSNMAQRHFLLALTMATDAAATSRDGSDP